MKSPNAFYGSTASHGHERYERSLGRYERPGKHCRGPPNSNLHIFTGGAVGPGCGIIDSANSNMFSPLFPVFANLYSAVKRNTNLTSCNGCWRYGGARRSGWAAQCSVSAVHSAKIFPENSK